MRLSDLPDLELLAEQRRALVDHANWIGQDNIEILIGGARVNKGIVDALLPELARRIMQQLAEVDLAITRLGVKIN